MKIEDIELSWLGHDGFLIDYKGKTIAIDPYNVSNNVGKADIILITHDHSDHCSIKDIEKVAKSDSVVIGPPHVQSAVMKIQGLQVQPIEVGDEVELDKGLKILAVAAYNLTKFRDKEKGIVFHPKSEGYVGYVIKLGNVVVYHTGDSDFIPEMKNLSGYGKHVNKFVALLPVSGTYVMSADEAVEVADVLHPDIAVPMHYGSIVGIVEEANRFVELCKERGIHAEILEK